MSWHRWFLVWGSTAASGLVLGWAIAVHSDVLLVIGLVGMAATTVFTAACAINASGR